MTWLVVVLFATGFGDMYIFEDPKYETREECMASLHQPDMVQKYTQKLLEEYQRFMPIQLVNCIEQEHLKQILKDDKIKHST